jgi:small subunit ribosomal protein S20
VANHKNAIKRNRQDLARRLRNRGHRSRMLRVAIESRDVAQSQGLLRPTLALVDHTAKLGAIPDKAADRTKSRLSRAVNRLVS